MKIYVYIMVLFTIGYFGVRYGAGRQLQRLIGPVFYFAIASTYLIAFLTPWPLVLLLWVAAMMMVGVKSRGEVACRYVMMMPLMPPVTPFLMLGSHVIGQFSPADFAAFGALAAGAMVRLRDPRLPSRGFGVEELAVLLLIVIFGVASVRVDDVSLLIRTVLAEIMTIGLPFWIIRRNVLTREDLQVVATCLGCVAAILSVLALYEHHAGWAIFDTLGQRFQQGGYVARSSMTRGGSLRASVTLGNPIEFGMVLVLGIIGTYCGRRLFARADVWRGMLALTFVGMLAAQSRSALIAGVIGAGVVLLVQRRWIPLSALVGVAAGGYLLLRALALSSVRVAAFMGAGRQVGVYKDYRTLLLERGLQEGRKHPYFGTTLAKVTERLRDLMQGEHIVDFVNSYLHVYLISGVVGLTLLLIAFAFVYQGLWQRGTSARAEASERARAFVLGGYTVIVIQITATSFYGRVPVLLGMMLGMARVIRRSEAKFHRPAIRPVLWETGQLRPGGAQPVAAPAG